MKIRRIDLRVLRALPGGGGMGEVDLLVGAHRVVVRAKGYKDVAEEITVSPNSTIERPYRLLRRRGPAWYATASTAILATVVGVFAIGKGKTSSPPVAAPLPPAPPPPAR